MILIVGQGITGSCLAYQCWLKNIPFKLIDDAEPLSASRVATGLFNPIVFKRITESWLASETIPYLTEFYRKFEQEFQCSVLHLKPLKRYVKTEGERLQWLKVFNLLNLHVVH